MAIRPVRTSLRSPWQNGIAERWVESCRRDLLDHVIALNERHLKRLVSEYVRYYHEDRPILAWTSKLRPAEFNPCSGGLSFLDPAWVACITATIELLDI
jgi:hypothetical protein